MSDSVCNKWKQNRSINPRTKRLIKENGPVYKKLQRKCTPEELKRRPRQPPRVVSNVCEKWLQNKLVNPKTGKTIKMNGPTYKKLLQECGPVEPVEPIRVIEIDEKSFEQIQQCEKVYVKRGDIPIHISGIKTTSKKKSPKKVEFQRNIEEIPTINIEYKEELEEKETPPIYTIGKDELQWDGHPTIKLTQMSPCLQDIIVNKYVASGQYGLVYRVKYKNMDCALKIIPINRVFEPVQAVSKFSDTEKEYNYLNVINEQYPNQNVAPQVYLYKTCKVKLDNKKINIAIIIMELLDITLDEYVHIKLNDLFNIQFESTSQWKMLLDEIINNFVNIDDKIKQDLVKCAKINILNEDTHQKNIMFNFNGVPMISDWGLAYDKIKSNWPLEPYESFNKNYYFTLLFLQQLQQEYGHYMTLDEKKYVESKYKEFYRIKFVKPIMN